MNVLVGTFVGAESLVEKGPLSISEEEKHNHANTSDIVFPLNSYDTK